MLAWCDFMQGLVEIPPLGQLTVGKIVTEMYYCILKLVVNYGNDDNNNHKYHLLQNYIVL